MASYVYIKSQPGLWTVGHYDGGPFEPESDHAVEEEAARRTAWLNGSPSDHHLLVEQRNELLARVDEQAAEIQRLRAVAEAVQKAIEVAQLKWPTSDEWVAVQGNAEIGLIEAMRALPAVAGQPHYHDPIECGCELSAADAPKVQLVCGCGISPDGAPGAYGCSPSCMQPEPNQATR